MKLTLRAALIWVFGLSILLPMLAISLYGHLFTVDALQARLIEDSQAEANLQASHLLHALERLSSDANYLGMLPTVQAWQASQNDEALRETVEADSLVFVAAHPQIYRLHWLNAAGQSLIIINSDSSSVYPMSADERRRYDDGGYFAEVMQQNPRSISASFGESDDTPVMLYSLRFANSALVFEVFSSAILKHLNATGQEWAVLDAAGNYLMRPLSFGNLVTAPSDLQAAFSENSGAFIMGDNVYAYSRFEAYTGANWLLYAQRPSAAIYNRISEFTYSSIALIAGAIVLAILIAKVLGAYLLRPILALKAEAENLRKGGTVQHKEYAIAELDALSQSFQQMATALAEESQQKRRILNKLFHAQESESKRIAYDLHDGLIQQLVGARLYVTMASDKSENGIKSDLERSSTAISEAIVEARRILQGLHPTILDDLGLADAIAEIAYQQAERYQWELDLQLETLPTLSKKMLAVTAFRISQEALNNIAKHADAKNVTIHLRHQDSLELLIQDDGKGFNLESLNGRGLGIHTMRERAELLGGSCEIQSKANEGTSIKLQLPLHD